MQLQPSEQRFEGPLCERAQIEHHRGGGSRTRISRLWTSAALALGVLFLAGPPLSAAEDEHVSEKQAAAEAAASVRILALGDSYTIGESVPEDQRWPVLLARELTTHGIAAESPRIIARTGWSTAQLADAMTRASFEPPYDLVTLLIGVNDQFRSFEEETYSERVASLLARAIELAGGDPSHVLMVSIPDYGVTPFGVRLGSDRVGRAIDRYNTRNREQAARVGVVHIDITPISREAESDPELVAPDGLHPSGKMYARWVERILPLAERVLRGDTAPAP